MGASPTIHEPPPVKLTALAAWGRGFVVGGNQGYVGVFKVDARLQVESFGTFRMPGETATIWQMCSGSTAEVGLHMISYIYTSIYIYLCIYMFVYYTYIFTHLYTNMYSN